ncbi:MAG TPA: hypothetical protein VF615_22345 [Longimicrobiaceae bacterium]|jgi:hypothetical protein
MLPPDPRWCARINAHRHPPEPEDPPVAIPAAVPAAVPLPAPPAVPAAAAPDGLDESCDVCGSTRTEWRKCKLVCLVCRQIVKSCADL